MFQNLLTFEYMIAFHTYGLELVVCRKTSKLIKTHNNYSFVMVAFDSIRGRILNLYANCKQRWEGYNCPYYFIFKTKKIGEYRKNKMFDLKFFVNLILYFISKHVFYILCINSQPIIFKNVIMCWFCSILVAKIMMN